MAQRLAMRSPSISRLCQQCGASLPQNDSTCRSGHVGFSTAARMPKVGEIYREFSLRSRKLHFLIIIGCCSRIKKPRLGYCPLQLNCPREIIPLRHGSKKDAINGVYRLPERQTHYLNSWLATAITSRSGNRIAVRRPSPGRSGNTQPVSVPIIR